METLWAQHKSAATRVYENDPTQSANAATLMLHQLDTHSKHYRKINKEQAAVRGFRAIEDAYGLDARIEENENDESGDHVQVELSLNSQSDAQWKRMCNGR